MRSYPTQPYKVAIHIFLIFIVIIVNLPMYFTVTLSTQNIGETLSNVLMPGRSIHANLEELLESDILTFILNSIITSFIIVLSKLTLSLLAGFAFSYFSFLAKRILFLFILFTLMVPEDIISIFLFRFLSGSLGLGNTYLGLVMPSLASAYGALLFYIHFLSLSPDLSEAAQLDGASPVQFLIHILIPSSFGVILVFIVIMFISSWNMYLWPLMMITDPDRQVIQVGLRMIASSEVGQQYGVTMLGAIIASIPPLGVFLLCQRHLPLGLAGAWQEQRDR